jgi:hypothetical protein
VRVGVIGGGVFGATIAVDLARAGAKVDLYEARSDLLDGATSRNQARLHRGYHYPRSDSTAAASRDAAVEFQARYPEAVRTRRHHYVIADDSRVPLDDYLAFCDRNGLVYERVTDSHVHHGHTLRVPEAFIDVAALRRLLRRDLRQAGVDLHFGRWVAPEHLDHDMIVVATYGQPWARPLRYEVCEVALIDLGRYVDESYVVLDGPFVSLDPTPLGYMLYDVTHSVHHANVGYAPQIPEPYWDWTRRGVVQSAASRFTVMCETASRNLRGLQPHGRDVCIYKGSLFSVRAVLPDVDDTDERPTLVERDRNVVSVLGGKICTAVTAARQITEALVAA